MYGDILITSVALLALIIATITDLKSKEVPDYLSYLLIALGFSYRIFYSILNYDLYYFLYGLLGFGVTFLIGVCLYYSRQWGGGDTKLLMGLGIIFATPPYFIQEKFFLLNLIFNIFLAGAIYGIFYGVYLAFKNKTKFLKELKRILEGSKIKFIRTFSFIISAILFILVLLSKDYATRIILFGFIIFLMFYIHLWIFVKSVENVCMFKTVQTSKLMDGDWVVEDVIAKKKLIYDKNKLSVEKKDILRFMKEGVKSVKIKDGIPFVPSFLIGTIVTLIFGSVFF